MGVGLLGAVIVDYGTALGDLALMGATWNSVSGVIGGTASRMRRLRRQPR
jgi:hypothetical protein